MGVLQRLMDNWRICVTAQQRIADVILFTQKISLSILFFLENDTTYLMLLCISVEIRCLMKLTL